MTKGLQEAVERVYEGDEMTSAGTAVPGGARPAVVGDTVPGDLPDDPAGDPGGGSVTACRRSGCGGREPAGPVRRFLAGLRTPVSREKRGLLEARWRELPAELRVGHQVVGRQLAHCGYTLGPSFCSFGCTHCYLPSNANRAPLPTLAEMKRQIDANRRLLGPDGGLQITGGDVVDAYQRADRAEELVEVLAYAADAGVVPMLMTHGQGLLEDPGYLERLVVDGRLRKVAIHVDITQAGRPGFPIGSLSRESELHPLRERFVDLLLGVRERTGRRLTAAHTVTVTERNQDSVGDILEWLLAERRRLRAFGMVSLQPEAAVGRTRSSERPVTPEATWSSVCEAVGVALDRDNLLFGHPDCSNMTTLLVAPGRGGSRVVNLVAADPASRRFWTRLLEIFGGVGSRGDDHARANGQRVGLLLRHPGFLLHALGWALSRWRAEGLGARFLADLARGRVGALNVVLHNFMDEAEVEGGGQVVEKRLAACGFRGAVERDGEWRAVPMCAMNAREREALYARQIDSERRRRGPGLREVDGNAGPHGGVSGG